MALPSYQRLLTPHTTVRLKNKLWYQHCKNAKWFHSHSTTSTKASSGMGYGNVHDQMLPTSQDDFRLFRHIKDPHTVSVIGAPMTYGQPYVGTDTSPSLLREAGLLSDLTSLGWRVEDLRDLDFSSNSHGFKQCANARNSLLVGHGAKILADLIQEKATKGSFPLSLGGDHSIAIGTLAGILKARPRTGVLWIDAHADLNTPDTSPSGNMHGMPIGLLLEGMDVDFNAIPGLEWLTSYGPKLDPSSLVYVGLRDVDIGERHAIRKLGICAFTMHDIDHYGIGVVMDKAISHLLDSDPNRPIHLSYDIDAVDPIHAPATGTAVRGGLTFREALYVAEVAAMSGNLASADLVELNPTLSDGRGVDETTLMGKMLVTSLLGKSII